MATTTVEMMTVKSAEDRRAEVLRSVGGDEATLRERARQYVLDEKELAAFDELEELDYLLGR